MKKYGGGERELSHTKTFSKGGALKKAGHHGLVKHGKDLLVTPSNVGKIAKAK